MTTITALMGFNKNGKLYVLFTSDSQWTEMDKDGKIVEKGYDAKKIFTNLERSMMFSHSGMYYFNLALQNDGRLKKGIIDFLHTHERPSVYVKKDLTILDALAKAENRRTEDMPKNTYLFSGKEDLMLSSQNLSSRNFAGLRYSMGGSGSRYLPFPGYSENFIRDLHEGNFENLLKNEFRKILDASKVDKFTGGSFSFGVLTKNNAFVFHEFAKLDRKRGAYGLFKESKGKFLKSYFAKSRGIASLDQLTL